MKNYILNFLRGFAEIVDQHGLRAENKRLEASNRELREKLRSTRKHLRAANKGAERNAMMAELFYRRAPLGKTCRE